MSKQEINIGTTANDGSGESIRSSFDKTNDNFTELYSVAGWGYYQDENLSTQVFNTTPSKITIDAGGANTNDDYLPYSIRGVNDLWDGANDKIVPISIGDSYNIRLDFIVDSEIGSPNNINIVLDIGGDVTPTINIVEMYVSAGKSTPYNVSVSFPIFCLTTFDTNGGQIFISTDAGSITVGNKAILITRTSSGVI